MFAQVIISLLIIYVLEMGDRYFFTDTDTGFICPTDTDTKLEIILIFQFFFYFGSNFFLEFFFSSIFSDFLKNH